MSTVVYEKEAGMQELVCRFCPNPIWPGEGHYRIQTVDGIFLANVGADELDYELSVFRQSGYKLIHIAGGEEAC